MKNKESKQEWQYNFYMNCFVDELEYNYNCFLGGYSHEAALIKLVAELRGFDTSDWKEFYR
jgi:hypothetical protein